MLRSTMEMIGYKVVASGDIIGHVHDFYFDDEVWMTRYFVVDTGNWLSSRKVLISPVALGQPVWEAQAFPAQVSREQVENSPHIDTDKPISRQQEGELHTHYDWPPYWGDVTPFEARSAGLHPEAYLNAMRVAGAEEELRETRKEDVELKEKTFEGERTGDPHLRSINEVTGYDIQAKDGEIGHVEDFVVEDDTWIMRYMVVDTRDWLPGKKVLVAPQWIEGVSWVESSVQVDLLRETIKNSPEYDPGAPVNREYETRLYDYYGRPKYWL